MHTDVAVVRLNDAVHHRQAQPGALIDVLRGKERLEDACLRVGVHPRACVADGEPHVAARLQMQMLARQVGVDPHGPDGHVQHALARIALHGLCGIGNQVHNYLLQLSGIAEHEAVLWGLGAQVRLGRKGGPGQFDRVGHHRREVEGCLHGLALGPTEGKKPVHQSAGPIQSREGMIEGCVEGGVVRKLVGKELQVGLCGVQDVVEVVGDAAGQRADCLHLLGLQELILKVFAPGDVEQHAVEDLLAVPGLRGGDASHPDRLSVGALEREGCAPRLFCFQGSLDGGRHGLAMRVGDAAQKAVRKVVGRICGNPEHRLGLRADEGRNVAAVRGLVHAVENAGHAVGEASKTRLAPAQGVDVAVAFDRDPGQCACRVDDGPIGFRGGVRLVVIEGERAQNLPVVRN